MKKSILPINLLVILTLLFINTSVEAADENISELAINPNNQKISLNNKVTDNQCWFDNDQFVLIRVDQEQKIIIRKSDEKAIKQALYDAKTYNKIVKIKSKTSRRNIAHPSIGSLGVQIKECTQNVQIVSEVEVEAINQDDQKDLKSQLAQCQQTVSNLATNINSSHGEAGSLAGVVTEASAAVQSSINQ